MKWACGKCQAHLVAYIHHDLDEKRRRQVARHLDECQTCYALYLQYQDLSQHLGQIMPLIGQNQRPALERVWKVVRHDLIRPAHGKPFTARYGLAVLVVSLMLLIPMTMGNRNVPPTSPATQPIPVTAQSTPNSTESADLAALQISVTPQANDRAAARPSLDAINTP